MAMALPRPSAIQSAELTAEFRFINNMDSEVSFWNFLDQRVKGVEKNIPWFVNDKQKAYNFFKDNGIPTPEIIFTYKAPEEINFAELPKSFCLKPSNMHSAAGVMPLVKVADGSYFDRLRKRIISVDGILAEQNLVFDRCKFKSSYSIIVEEGLGHDSNEFLIPFDYKLYTFSDSVGLILQIDRNSSKTYISFHDGDFNPLPAGSVINTAAKSISHYGHPVAPLHAKQMLECAKRIPKLLNTPFVSVDMYSTKKGFYVGEITPAPGGPYYKSVFELLPEYDEMLGDMWSSFNNGN